MTDSPLPMPDAVRAEARITLNRSLGGANHRVRIAVPQWPGSLPGQFVMLSPGALAGVRRDDPLLPRPMAVYREAPGSAAEPPAIEILYKVEGRGTALLAQAEAGNRLRVVGPLGRPFPLPEPGTRVAVLGGGTGIASLRGLVEALVPGCSVKVLLGARSQRDLMGEADLRALTAEVEITTEDGSVGEKGLVTAPLERLLVAGDCERVYCCGPTPMMRRCAELAAHYGVRCVVSLENNMACGFGVCLGCAVPRPAGNYALVCRDGPVFDADEIDWESLR